MENPETNQYVSEHLSMSIAKFPGPLEKEYKEWYLRKSILLIRMSLILGALLYSFFAFLDKCLIPQYCCSFFIIRFAVVVPFMLITLGLTFLRVFKKIMSLMMGLVVLLAGFGIIAMIAIIKEGNFSLYYYAGLILVIMWTFNLTRLNFFTATILCWIIIIGYEIVAIFYQNLLESPELTLVFINNNFFFISANIIGMLVSYFIEMSERRDFIQGRTIEHNQNLLMKERNILAKNNQEMKGEMEMARSIQEQLIPKKTPGKNLYAFYKPMEEVGGDFYDFMCFRGSEKIGIFLSDVSGHGVPAALITSMIKSVLVEAKNLLDNPKALLTHLNKVLIKQIQNNFVTVFYGIYDKKDRSMIFANGGHPNPYICSPDKVSQISLKEQRFPVGALSPGTLMDTGKLYHNYRVYLPEKSKILFYTDGLVEAQKIGGSNEWFEDKIVSVLENIKMLGPEEFVKSLYLSLKKYRGDDNFEDDICMICLDTDFIDEENENLEEL